MKASKFVNTIRHYMKNEAKQYGMRNEICYPYCDLYGFTGIKVLKKQIVLIPERPETPLYNRIDQFPDTRLKLDALLSLIEEAMIKDGDKDLYFKNFGGVKEPVTHWQTTYQMVVPLCID